MTDPLAALASALRDRYAVDRQVGEGGMATVYRADDLKHRRPVAIKLLRPELAATIGTERFLREIEMAARLQHPHVVPVYDSGAAEGQLYYVMPFIDGESLRDRLQRDGALPLAEAIRLTREAASALHFAHQQGVVHRDVKPENIMLSGGHAVVADFGIARAAAPQPGTARLTGMGIAIGTPAYMSPEQATADDVDARADQYALACVFYEMATGRQAFTGKSVQALLASHITGPRPRLSDSGAAVAAAAISTRIDAVLAQALSTDRDRRFPSVMAFAEALEAAAQGGGSAAGGGSRWRLVAAAAAIAVVAGSGAWLLRGAGGAPVKAGAERIAILPFTVAGAGDATLGEGMVSLLTTNFGTVPQLQTVDPQTLFVQWRKRGGADGVDLAAALDIARATKASAALLGSVTNLGTRVRLAATLYGLDGAELGKAQVEGAADSVITLVDDLSARLVQEIWKSKEPLPSLNVAGVTTSSLPALRAYLQGEQYYRRGQWDSAQAAFEAATAADSTFALAHYRLAMAHGWSGDNSSPVASRASAAAARFSDRLPPRERTLVRAYRLFQQGRPEAADSMRRYLATHPGDPAAWYLLGESVHHARELHPVPPESTYVIFGRVTAIDSTLTAAVIHPIELAVAGHDRQRYDRYMALLGAAADTALTASWRAVGDVAFGAGLPDDSTLGRLLRTGWGGMGSTVAALGRADGGDPARMLALLARIDSAARTSGDPRLAEFSLMRGVALVGFGRLGEARAHAAALTKSPRATDAQFLMILPAMAGIAPGAEARAVAERMAQVAAREETPFPALMAATTSLARGDAPAARRVTGGWLARDTAALPPGFRMARHLMVAQRGWAAALEGDTAAAIRDLRLGLGALHNQLGPALKDPVRFQLAVLLASRPESEAEGLAMLEHAFGFPMMQAQAELALARTHERRGRRDAAIAHYQRFLRMWEGADASVADRGTEATEALAKLLGET